MLISFSFRYNSSSFRFGLIPWQFQNRMFNHESDQGIPVMDDDALQWPTWRFQAVWGQPWWILWW